MMLMVLARHLYASKTPRQRYQGLIRRYPRGRPDPFRSVRDLGRFLARCLCQSGEAEGRSSVWLPAWLPRHRARPDLSVGCDPRQQEGSDREPSCPSRARFALGAVGTVCHQGSQARPRLVLIGQTLASLDKELPLHGEPAIAPFRLRPGIWMVTAELDVRPVEPNDPDNHCRYVAHHFGAGVYSGRPAASPLRGPGGGIGGQALGRGSPAATASWCTRRCGM